jgi:dienelactone hydrolase
MILIEDIEYLHDSTRCRGVLAVDDRWHKERPGVLVVHEAWGLGKHAIDRALMLASMGYPAFAADMYGDRKCPSSLAEARVFTSQLRASPRVLRDRARAALSVLADRPEVDRSRLAAIGFCFGGTTVLELARCGEKLAAVASFHGGLLPVGEPSSSICPSVMVFVGARDPLGSAEHIGAFEREMEAAGADYQIQIFGNTLHSFTNPDAGLAGSPKDFQYSPVADRRAWRAVRGFLRESFHK